MFGDTFTVYIVNYDKIPYCTFITIMVENVTVSSQTQYTNGQYIVCKICLLNKKEK